MPFVPPRLGPYLLLPLPSCVHLASVHHLLTFLFSHLDIESLQSVMTARLSRVRIDSVFICQELI